MVREKSVAFTKESMNSICFQCEELLSIENGFSSLARATCSNYSFLKENTSHLSKAGVFFEECLRFKAKISLREEGESQLLFLWTCVETYLEYTN